MSKHLLNPDSCLRDIRSTSGERSETGTRAVSRRRSRGFTFLEIMIAMVVVGIVTAVALSSYKNAIMKSKRHAAATALLDLASREEKFYSLSNNYSATPTDLGLDASTTFPLSVPPTGTAAYTIAAPTIVLAAPTAVPPTPATFTFTATPTSNQSGDACGSFTINSIGQQTVTGTASAASCW